MSNGVDFKRMAIESRDLLDAALGREAASREELGQCGSMAAMIEGKEWAEHAGTGPVSSRVESAFTQLHNELSEAQQRLTVAEQRAGDLEGMLRHFALCADVRSVGVAAMNFVAALKPAEEVDSWKQWSVGDTVEYLGSGDSREDCYSCMTIGNKYSITEAPDDFETMVVLDDDGDEISVTSGDFRRIKP